MKRNNFLKVFLLLTVAVAFLIVSSYVVKACVCVVWEYHSWVCCVGGPPCVSGWCSDAYCAAEDCESIDCTPGNYPCNRGCCAIDFGGNDPEPPPDTCNPSCSGRECGPASCGPTTCPDTCGLFKKECSSNTCNYYDANVTATATTPCINTSSASKTIVVSGKSNYCGNISIVTPWSYTYNLTDTAAANDMKGLTAYTYSQLVSIPQSVINSYIETKTPLSIEVRGNRNAVKDTKDEDPDIYDCDEILHVSLTFDNFYYCPTYGEHETEYEEAGFDYYNETSYYVSNTDGYFAWDECTSNPLTDRCTPNPTDCVDISGTTYSLNISSDADDSEEPNTEKEYEVCVSKNGIQGGWTDADSASKICTKITQKAKLWFDCTRPSQCQYGKNDFSNTKLNGLCCGDDYGEIPLRTTRTDTDGAPLPGYYSSCCAESFSCADKEGVCRTLGTSECLDEGRRGKCTYNGDIYFWNETDDNTCQKPCVICNINKEESSVYQIDHFDLDSILTAIEAGSTDTETYDTNKDGIIDNGDYEYCQNFFGQPCSSCIDGVFIATEECQENTVTGKIEFHDNIAPPLNCEEKISFIRDNTTCLPSCSANYTSKCVKGQCGASCGTDLDCTTDITRNDYRCNKETCSCEPIGCSVGTTLCQDESCSANCTTTDTGNQGCINDNHECDAGEGCACSDCTNKRDSCTYGAICGENNLCVCPLGTTLCLDGTCSFDCTKTDTGAQGCILQNTICEPGEGCGCVDCNGKQDSCILGGVCNFLTEQCELVCTPTENVEITINDGIDNDCDGLIDEPEFWPGYGVYVWEAGCNYYMCVYGDDSKEHNTTGLLSVSGDYKIYKIKQYNWETDDTFAQTLDGKQLTFKSKLYNNLDCLFFKTETMVKFDLTLDGIKNTNKIYLTQNKNRPLENPFYYSSPECSQSCLSPGGCGLSSTFCGITGCGYERCIFDCGGYWVNGSAGAICTFLDSTSGDSCNACVQNMSCSNYTNIASCNFDPCNGALTPFGCRWNTATGKCVDNFEYCMPGTTLCKDGTCSKDCKTTDWKNAGCIGKPNKKCDVGEGCSCSDCENKRDTCTFGAVCGSDELCGCPIGTTLCNDKTCDVTCDAHGGKTGCNNGIANGVCEFGEGCACTDCDFSQDSCVSGALCSRFMGLCLDGISEYCKSGTTLCNDLTCDETCKDHNGKRGCNGEPNGKCESLEGCACEDCDTRRDSCEKGLKCDFEEKLCTGVSESPDCTDSDNDGYFKKESSCFSGDDCDDSSSFVNPSAIELCNGIDDNCNAQIDESCSEIKLDVTIDTTQEARVLDTFKLKIKLTNQYSKPLDNLKLVLQLPQKLRMKSNSASVSLSPKETKEVTFDVIVEDYVKETAMLTLKAQVGTEEIITKEIPLIIEIPEFGIFAMPGSEQEDNNELCFDLYYVLNRKDSGKYDIEMDISDPASFFGRSVIVDYVSDIESTGDVIILPMVSNPYCLPLGREYELGGYLYKEGIFGIAENIGTNSVYIKT